MNGPNCVLTLEMSTFIRYFAGVLIRPVENSIYSICDPLGIKLLHRLRLGFSHLRENKFRHNFEDIVNP